MNDGMNNVPTTTGERSMGLYAWHKCVHDEEEAGGGGEAGGINLGISLGEALLDFRLAFFFSFLPSLEGADLACCCWVWDGYPPYLMGHAAIGMAWHERLFFLRSWDI